MLYEVITLNAKSESVRLSAAQDILGRAGMNHKQEIQVNHTLTTKEQYNAILNEIREALSNQDAIDVTPIEDKEKLIEST